MSGESWQAVAPYPQEARSRSLSCSRQFGRMGYRVFVAAAALTVAVMLVVASSHARTSTRRTALTARGKTLPAGWKATWDAKANRYYYSNTMTGEVTWDGPEEVPSLREDIHRTLAQQRAQQRGPAARGSKALQPDAGDCSDVNISDTQAIIACWQERGKQEMQQSKNRAFDAAVADSYDDYDVSKGRAMHKFYNGAPGGGEGFWPNEAPSSPSRGMRSSKGLGRPFPRIGRNMTRAEGLLYRRAQRETQREGDWLLEHALLPRIRLAATAVVA